MLKSIAVFCLLASNTVFGQTVGADPSPSQPATQAQNPDGLRQRPEPSPGGTFQVDAGTRILLNMINSVSTKQAAVGDRIYLETAFPIIANNRIIIPQGSWVTGTITEVKRPGRAKGRGEIQVRFDSLTLINGVTRNFHADLAAVDGRGDETLKREQSKVQGPGDKKGDVGTVIGGTVAGGVIGTGIGAATGHIGSGSAIGLGAGAAAGLLGVLLTRGPDAVLTKGSSVEMILDRPIAYSAADLDLTGAPPRAPLTEGTAPASAQQKGGWLPTRPY